MKHWWADTLFKRLFLLMWFGLVASHLLAFYVTTHFHAPPGAGAPGIERLPVLPSLPPTAGLPGDKRPPPPPEGGPRAGPPPGPPPDAPPQARPDRTPRAEPGGLPADALWLDYGVRFLAIGVVAWFGARWLSAPMRKLADASEGLGRTLGQASQRAPRLDEHRGTLEVRQTAQVFNAMAQRLQTQFNAQRLLMAAISHDLRTPLARLRLRLEAMGTDASAAQSARSIADVREMDTLIGSVLEMMRDQHVAEAPQRVDVIALVNSLVDDLVEQGRPAEFVGGAAGPVAPAIVQAQPSALRRVLGNLIGNALQHGGSARVSIAAGDGRVRVIVDDEGPGIPAHQLDAVFAPFYRADPGRASSSGGSGLGLYIARDLTERFGGSLALSNRAPRGLRAELSLPLV